MPMTSESTDGMIPVHVSERPFARSTACGRAATPPRCPHMRGLALCLIAGALLVAGCGDKDPGASAPVASTATKTTTGSGQSAAVSAAPVAKPASLCAVEGKAALKRKCVSGLKNLNKGKAKNPRAACKGLSKKKTKGVKGKSPFAACVSAAAKLLASKNSKHGSGNGAADSGGGGGSGGGGSKGSKGSGSSTSADDAVDNTPVCVDANGNDVSPDSPDVEECTDPNDPGTDDTSASDSSNDSSSSSDGSSDSTDTSSSDSSGDSS